ncbi:helix-turn-helix transcriptional regulator [Paenibacillus sp. PR3]|uniref:Helix-turn-helix transcriptional regulator n=1 Tax=Paenibacillus terricola TaxID=2763503 RepID=A0ABR8MX44_9BACL|nr:helix-turn-helix transcriptional regulator [Paenibacillus terricola]MBD3919861.1 helix-turn-helix transcriptional regulator [Paenibacillus terricola]
MDKELGQRIAELRHRRRWTQEQLGQQLGVSGQAVSKWENGDSLPDTTLLVDLARALDCTTDYLLGADAEESVSRYIPSLEAGIRKLEPSESIDMAFRLFNMFDDISRVHTKAVLEGEPTSDEKRFVHAGPEGITLWWSGKLFCTLSIDVLKETQACFQDDTMPFDLFPEGWDRALTAVMSQHPFFFSGRAAVDNLRNRTHALDDGNEEVVQALIDSGFLENGRGGYRIGFQAEVLLRVIGAMMQTIGKPTSMSHRSNLSVPTDSI